MNPVIIYPPTVDWDHLHQRPQQLLKAASKNGAVGVFCNTNIERRHSFGIEYLTPTMALANNMPLASTVQWARNAYQGHPVVILYSYPSQVTDVMRAGADLVIFDSLDEPEGEFAHWFTHYESAVMNAGMVTASASSLQERARKYRTDDVMLIQNGCDYEHFMQAQERHPVNESPFTQGKKIVGFIGAVATWLDWDLIRNTAAALPMMNFVFIGPMYGFVTPPVGATNIFYLGLKDYNELPRYLSNFDVCTIPFKIDQMTRGVSPIKMWEYLASGIPVISTPLPEAQRCRGVTIANHTTYVEEIKRAVDWREREAMEHIEASLLRRHTAQKNSWNERAKRLLEAIDTRIPSAQRVEPSPNKLYRKKALLEVIEKRPDGYLVQNHGDPSDRWVIPTKTFEDTYEEA